MIATLEIDDDVLADAERLANQECRTAGKVLSELARQALLDRLDQHSQNDSDSEMNDLRQINLGQLLTQFVDFLTHRPSLKDVADYKIPSKYQERLEDLLETNQAQRLTQEEKTELETYFQLRHVVTLLKARARKSIVG